MPGKQMSIDSDLNAGLIDESEARQRRKMLAAEAEFYGAMDGASRFTQRDAVASIIITAINIIAGFLIGVLQNGMDLKRALQTYTILTIGDGLVTVIPALMISISGGLIVTRASSEGQISTEFTRQVFSNPQPLFLTSGVLVALAFFPGLPVGPFLLLGGGIGYGARRLRQRKAALQAEKAETPAATPAKETIESLLRVEPLAIEVGLGLVKIVEGGASSPLLKRIAGLRRQIATELGYIVPPVRVTDNLQLRAREYVISLKGIELSRYELASGCELAIQTGTKPLPVQGIETREPAFGIPAVWVPSNAIDRARAAGCTVVDPLSVLATHLGELIRASAHELFSRQDAKKVLDRVGEENSKLVEDLVPKLLPLAAVQKVLQNLLRERVSIRDASSILEALGEAAHVTKNTVLLTEYVRQSIRRMVVKPYLNSKGELPAYFFDAQIEGAVEASAEHSENMSHITLAPQRVREIVEAMHRTVGLPETPVVALASSGARFFLRQISENGLRNLYILSHTEVPTGVKVLSLGVIR
jgi:flagellar biosynthesis protein FlhA